jgi:hypothetical protein
VLLDFLEDCYVGLMTLLVIWPLRVVAVVLEGMAELMTLRYWRRLFAFYRRRPRLLIPFAVVYVAFFSITLTLWLR